MTIYQEIETTNFDVHLLAFFSVYSYNKYTANIYQSMGAIYYILLISKIKLRLYRYVSTTKTASFKNYQRRHSKV